MSGFKVGDRVRVVVSGWGVAPRGIGEVVIIKEKYGYNSYSVHPGQHPEYYSGVIDERSFELVVVETPAEKAKMKIGDKFIVTKNSYGVTKGDIVEFVRDDGTNIPQFKLLKTGVESYQNITDVRPYNTYIEHLVKLELEQTVKPIEYSITLETDSTSFEVAKRLSKEQIASIIAIIEGNS